LFQNEGVRSFVIVAALLCDPLVATAAFSVWRAHLCSSRMKRMAQKEFNT
jgi:hypothetical protein